MFIAIVKYMARTKPVQRARRIIRGNRYGISSVKSEKNRVNLEYSHRYNLNLGDALSPVIVSWMLERENLTLESPASATKHLMAVGSIIDRGSFDVTVWGSGILTENSKRVLRSQHGVRTFDVRAVRGPITRGALLNARFSCPETYGDPAILLPLMYTPREINECKRSDCVGLVLHHASDTDVSGLDALELKQINISTTDYQAFIDNLAQVHKVISSSLHGIIIAESYGVPAVYLKDEGAVGKQRVKFDDWYQSTGRFGVEPAESIEEALEMEPPALPDLTRMQEGLLDCFPYDLWDLRR